MGNYGINSNTSAGGFLKCTYKKEEKLKAVNSVYAPPPEAKKGKKKKEQKKEPKKEYVLKKEIDVMSPFKDLYNSNIAKVMRIYGKQTAPLPLIGHWLNFVGNHLLHFLYCLTAKKKLFYPMHQAKSIHLL